MATWGTRRLPGGVTFDGAVTANGGVVGYPRVLPIADANDSGALLSTAGRAYARYMGFDAPKRLTAADMIAYLGTAAAASTGGDSANWAEVAIATGTFAAGTAAINLTILAYASIAAEAVATSSARSVVKSLSGFTIEPGQGLWAITASSFETTQTTYRIPSGTNVEGATRIRASTRPSLNLNTPLQFDWTVGAQLAAPWLRMVI